MSNYDLQDYRRPRIYRLDAETGHVEILKCKTTQEAFGRSVGYAAWVRVGLLRAAEKKFVALFTDGTTLLLRYGDKAIDCLANRIEASREDGILGVKHFRLAVNGKAVIDDSYFWLDTATWPDNGDILSHVSRITRTRESMFFIVLLRKASLEGRDVNTPEVAQELKSRADELARET